MKILNSTVNSIDDIRNCFLSTKTAYSKFLKDQVTLKTGLMMLKIQLCITGKKKYILK